jgi:uncharacterized membrane protein
MTDIALILSLILAVTIYGNLSLVIAAELLSADLLSLSIVAVGWATLFLIVFLAFTQKIINFFSRFQFFKRWLAKVKEKAKGYPKYSVAGVVLATIVPLPPAGMHCGSIVGLTIGFSRLKTFAIVWTSNLLQFMVMYLIVSAII